MKAGKIKLMLRRLTLVAMLAVLAVSVAAIGRQSTAAVSKHADGMYSANMLLMDLENEKVISSAGSDEKIYPASLTKIMTAVVCIEAAQDLDDTAALSEENYQRLLSENASMAGFLPGEEVSVTDLLYGMMLPSGADAAVTLAQKYFGSESNCAKAMNGKADVLGMSHTHFTNVTGLHDDEHYSTLEDLAKLLVYALDNETFRKIFTASVYETEKTPQHPDGLMLESTLFGRISLETFEDITLLGGKTGFTDKAGLCLATLANIDGREYILITAGADGKSAASPYHIVDAVHVYETLSEHVSH